MRKVLIYQKARNVMQSGESGTKKWYIKYVPIDSRFVDPLTGWNGNKDTRVQKELKFETQEQALDYAKRNNLSYVVKKSAKKKIKIQSYADNFTS